MSAKYPVDAIPTAERVRNHSMRLRKAGLVRVSVWVPGAQANEIHQLAARLRQRAGVTLPRDKRPPTESK